MEMVQIKGDWRDMTTEQDLSLDWVLCWRENASKDIIGSLNCIEMPMEDQHEC